MGNQGKAYACGLGAVLLWSTVATAFKLSLRHLEPAQLVFYASACSLLALGAILVFRGCFALVFTCTLRQYLQSLGLGLLNPCLYYLVLFEAYARLPAQEAQPLNYTWAIVLALLSIPLLGQRPGAGDIGGGLVAYSGVVVIATRGQVTDLHFADPVGVALALGSTLVWALYWIFNARDPRDPVVGLFLNFAFGLPFALLFCALFSDLEVASARGLLGAAYVGAFEMGFTFALWLAALRQSANASRVGNLIFLSPFFSLVFIHYLVGEQILASTFWGLGLIVSGLLLQRLAAARRPLTGGE